MGAVQRGKPCVEDCVVTTPGWTRKVRNLVLFAQMCGVCCNFETDNAMRSSLDERMVYRRSCLEVLEVLSTPRTQITALRLAADAVAADSSLTLVNGSSLMSSSTPRFDSRYRTGSPVVQQKGLKYFTSTVLFFHSRWKGPWQAAKEHMRQGKRNTHKAHCMNLVIRLLTLEVTELGLV
jgi:hypothetical protein